MRRNEELERRFAGIMLGSKRNMAAVSTTRQEKINARVNQLETLIIASQELDLAFLVDVTYSMQPYINSVKAKLQSIAAAVKKAWLHLKLRVAFVPYRDYEDTARDNKEMCDFTDDFRGPHSIFVKALSRVCAAGGGDEAEDVFSGLHRVASLTWKARTRVLVHIADAPCHGVEFHDIVSDRFPGGDFQNRNISTLLGTLRDNCQINSYSFCHVNNSTKKMLSVFKKKCGTGNWIHEEKLNNIDKLVDIVVNVTTISIAKSLQVGDTNLAVRKFVKKPVEPEMPLWSSIPHKRATQMVYKLPSSLEDLFHILATNGKFEMTEMPDVTVQIAHYPFSHGESLRWSYHAMLNQPPGATRHMVVKRFKETFGQDVRIIHAKEAYFQQMEVQTVAAKLAEEFNKEIKRLSVREYKTIQFSLVSALRVGTMLYNMEKFLEGKFVRYSNNLNYVNRKDYAATLHAFSHWTYCRSQGLLVVNDLQGVERLGINGSTEYWLCDPAVLCKDVLRYQRTGKNWSEPGMKLFLTAHRCNHICGILGLIV